MPVASLPDLLRLVAVPVLAWAAWRDVRTRRVPNRTWLPLFALGGVLLARDAWVAWSAPAPYRWTLFAVPAAVSLGVVVPLAYLFWRLGGFGGADAKALMALAVLFPAYPAYVVPGRTLALPLVESTVGAFSLSVLTNTVLVALASPLLLAVRNAAAGRVRPLMFVGRPVPCERLPAVHGRLLETPDGPTRDGLDLDALRMYLRWRGASLSDVRADPDRHRDPASLPAAPNPVGDGAVAGAERREDDDPLGGEVVAGSGETTEGDEATGEAGEATAGEGTVEGDEATAAAGETTTAAGEATAGSGETTEGDDAPVGGADGVNPTPAGADALAPDPDDDWGAAAFLADVGDAYGTSPADLRAALDLLAERESVWVSPGLPFIVPTLVGLVVALTYGDVLYAVLAAAGLG